MGTSNSNNTNNSTLTNGTPKEMPKNSANSIPACNTTEDPTQEGAKPMMQRMLDGEWHTCRVPQMRAEMAKAEAWLDRFNGSLGLSMEQRKQILRERIGHLGEGASIKPPFHAYMGFNIHLAKGAFVNFNCMIQDACTVDIGENALIGPFTQLYTVSHAMEIDKRAEGWEIGRPIRIGANAWIGGGAIILPGVTIGENATVGAGSVVTKDVPPNTTVVGSPARPVVKKNGEANGKANGNVRQ